MKIIDSHAHLTHFDAETLNKQIDASGIAAWIQGGYNPEDWIKQDSVTSQYPSRVFNTYGLHPWHIAGSNDETLAADFSKLEKHFKNSKAIALGECGLDFHKKFAVDTHERQVDYFQKQLQLAHDLKLPLVLHIVQAHERAYDILRKNSGLVTNGGIVHSFSGTYDTAAKYIDLGLGISIGPSVLKDGFGTLKRAVPLIPEGALLLETDAPDQISDLTGLFQVAKTVAALRGVPSEAVLEKSTQNAKRIFGI